MKINTYKEIVDSLKKKKRIKHLLLGNGFSMSYDTKIFSYNALSNFINNTDDQLLQKLFGIINTTNFELIMSQLDIFHQLAVEFLEDKGLAEQILNASAALKEKLVDAISELHPEHVFNIPQEMSQNCAGFLKEYLDNDGHIFTANYDLLLYWVLMSNQKQMSNFVDGFGREYLGKDESDKDAEPEYGDLEWGPNRSQQRVHYLHGALHIFDKGTSIEKEIYDGEYLLNNIKNRIEKKEYPVFVTAGNGEQKLEHILHNQYLDFCYKKLSTLSGSLVTFGFNFGKYDHHIIDAINKAANQDMDKKLWSVYIGIYTEKGLKHIEQITPMFKCKVNIFDARTVGVWGQKNG